MNIYYSFYWFVKVDNQHYKNEKRKGCNWSLPLVPRGRGVPFVQVLRGVPDRRMYIKIQYNVSSFNVKQFVPNNKNYAFKIIQYKITLFWKAIYFPTISIWHHRCVCNKIYAFKKKQPLNKVWNEHYMEKTRSRWILPQAHLSQAFRQVQGHLFHPK